MNAKITHWVAELAANTYQFKQHFDGLSSEELNWKPDPQTWSIAQNIDHLITINSTYFPILDDVLADRYPAPWLGRLAFIPRMMGNLVYNACLPDRQKKMKTFPIWEPAQSEINGSIVEQFEQHQAVLSDYIQKSESALTRGVVIRSPAQSSLIYPLEKAFDIIIVHEKRHLEQAKEVQRARQVL